jgi:hypothetical protein
MKNNIRFLLQSAFLMLLIPSVIYSQDNSIGKLVKKNGYVKKTNINCDTDECVRDNLLIYPGDRIETGKKSSVSILLNDGTSVELHEKSDLIILSIINKRDKTLTSIFSDYGKFKIIQENDFFDASLVVKTRTAIIKSVSASMSIITGSDETGIFVYKGEAGFANIDPAVIEAYVIQSGYESFLKRNTPPLTPVKVQKTLRTSWIMRHFLTKENEKILRYNKTNGAADWFFIEKK